MFLRKLFGKLLGKQAATLFEYAIILFLVSIVAILVLQGIGSKTNNMVSSVNDGFQQ